MYLLFERGFQLIQSAYDWTLRGVLRHRFVTLMASFVIVVFTVQLFIQIPKGFLPSEDSGGMFGITQAAQGISFDAMKQHQIEVTKIITDDPNVSDVMSFAGAGLPGYGGNSGFFFVHLKDRPSASQDMMDSIRRLFHLPGAPARSQPALHQHGRRDQRAAPAHALPSRRHCLHAESPAHSDRRPTDAKPLPVHRGRRRIPGSFTRTRRISKTRCANCPASRM